MKHRRYDWQRYWVKRQGAIYLNDDGYLLGPNEARRVFMRTDLVATPELASVPCLVLLGEPGIGKSDAMRSLYGTAMQTNDSCTTSLCIDLHSFSSEDRLVHKIFQSPEVEAWIKGSHQLELYLDSLDECLLRIGVVASILVDELRTLPVDRLRLRIACRTADWPASLEERLGELWGESSTGVYELAPLRRDDVALAVESEGLDSCAFLREVEAIQAVPFAIKPITLRFLINSYSRCSHLPSSQIELYREGCRLLCEESNQSRRESRLQGDLDPGQRFAIASRIAALTTLCGRTAVRKDPDYGDTGPDDISLAAIAGGVEETRGTRVQVTEPAIREALNTGLFSARGQNRLGWVHQSYAEFLTAMYLSEHHTGLEQNLSLLTAALDTGMDLAPQLHEVAAWLSSMDNSFFEYVLQH